MEIFGSYKSSPASESVNTAYVFSRNDLSRPALQLPGASKAAVAVRFCPLAFSLRGSNSANAGYFKLPYRLVFAVATLNSLYIYDTETVIPLAIFAGLHYAAITDVAWSPNGKYLALSSQDGYCTLVEFQSEELGLPLPLSDVKAATNHGTGGQKLAEMPVEASENGNPDILVKKLVDSTKGEDAMPATTSTPPMANKPAKRRITPIAIDP